MDKREKAEEAVDMIEQGFGVYPGYRRAHARGEVYEAEFTANGAAARWTTAPHFTRSPVRAVVRFSHFSPDPLWLDDESPVKGMAVRFELPDGQRASIVSVTSPVFFARTPETFNEMVSIYRSFSNGNPQVGSLFKLFLNYPDSRSGLKALRKMRAPGSFATGTYYAIHAFYFINEEGRRQPIKYEWVPDAETGRPSRGKGEFGYFEREMEERLSRGPVGFRLFIRLGRPDDPTDDPTKLWPDSRERIEIGHLSIRHRTSDLGGILFDPCEVTAGIEPSEDPILRFRPEAYRISHKRRQEGR